MAVRSARARALPRPAGAARKPTTIGDLVVALTDETSRFVRDEEEVYRVVADRLSEILFGSRVCSRKWH